jgi:hypothetical protein
MESCTMAKLPAKEIKGISKLLWWAIVPIANSGAIIPI